MDQTGLAKIRFFSKAIIEWYEKYGNKDLPWRQTTDPWKVLISTILLRKTKVDQVKNVYHKFFNQFPGPEAVLSAGEDEVTSIIGTLGLRSRANNIYQISKDLVEKFGGKVPCSKKELKSLKGVGEYTAAEVILRACGGREPLLDTNMIRILQRFFGYKSNRKYAHKDPRLWNFARSLLPEDHEKAVLFNFGIMDFARVICKSREPLCGKCSLREYCEYFKTKSKRLKN